MQATPVLSQPREGTAAALSVAVNGRYRAHKVAGQQRYANELIQRLGRNVELLEPATPLKGLRGHAWEQTALPRASGKRLLWSPCQTGPAFHKRHVVTFHDVFALENPEWFSRQYVLVYRYLLPLLARNASRLISVSEFTKQRMMAVMGVPEEKIQVIHSGIGEQFRQCSAPEIATMRAQLKLPSARYLLSVSSLEPRKNVTGILEAWRRIQPQMPEDLWLVMSGANGSAAVFAGQPLNVDGLRVFFTGYVDDTVLPALYAGAQGFLYPSLAEGFGFPVLEAMACGAPTLSANTSSLPEVTGDASLLVDPADPDAIAKGIFDLMQDDNLRRELRQKGMRQAARFTWDRSAEQTLQVLQEESERLTKKDHKPGART